MFLFNPLRQFNWLDIFLVVFLVRIGFIALKNGLPLEFFKFCGTIFALSLGLHYYSVISFFLSGLGRAGKAESFLSLLNLLSFIFLAEVAYLAFVLLRIVFCRFLKLEATPQVNRWGGFTLGMARGVLFAGLISFALLIAPLGYLGSSVRSSFTGARFIRIAFGVYSGVYKGAVIKFFPGGKLNNSALEALKGNSQ